MRHVVSNHGGEIDVASEEGLGSVFSILLRAPARADAGADTAAPGYDVDLSDVRVEEGRWS